MSKVTQDSSSGIEICLSWQPASGGVIPDDAVPAGEDLYVARAKLQGVWTPGKVAKGHEHAYVPWGGEEHKVESYQVLVDTCIGTFGAGHHWEAAANGEVPKRALVAGHDEGAPLFVARGTVEGEVCVGKVLPSHGVAYLPHGDHEHKVTEYEVLVFDKASS